MATPGKYKEVDLTGTVNLIEGAKKAGVKKFVLLTSLLTNAKAIGQQDNPNYKFLNAFGGGESCVTQKHESIESCVTQWSKMFRCVVSA